MISKVVNIYDSVMTDPYKYHYNIMRSLCDQANSFLWNMLKKQYFMLLDHFLFHTLDEGLSDLDGVSSGVQPPAYWCGSSS